MTEKELIRRALLGDQQAQKECTEKEIVLPCPHCGSNKINKKYACGDYWYSCELAKQILACTEIIGYRYQNGTPAQRHQLVGVVFAVGKNLEVKVFFAM